MPPTVNSASARRARSRACVRLAPVTISLPISESNACGTVWPAPYPASSRTPGPDGGFHSVIVPGRGQEVPRRVLGVDPELDRVPAQLRVVVAELLAVGDPEHLPHQVDAADLLGDRVLDLEPGVHLEEADRAVGGDEELAGARADVARLAQDRLRRVVELLDLRVGQERRGRLLDQLLVPPLQRAVAGRDDHDVAVRVGQALGLHVPRPVQVALDEALAVAERRRGLAHGRLVLARRSRRGCGRP